MTITYNLSQLKTVAQQVLKNSKESVILFYGDMGVGKTTLIKELLRQLGIKEIAQSPTFSIVNEYEGPQGELIYHFDCYRLQEEEEILDLGFEDYLSQADWVFIEWPDKISSFLPLYVQKICLNIVENDNRQLLLC